MLALFALLCRLLVGQNRMEELHGTEDFLLGLLRRERGAHWGRSIRKYREHLRACIYFGDWKARLLRSITTCASDIAHTIRFGADWLTYEICYQYS